MKKIFVFIAVLVFNSVVCFPLDLKDVDLMSGIKDGSAQIVTLPIGYSGILTLNKNLRFLAFPEAAPDNQGQEVALLPKFDEYLGGKTVTPPTADRSIVLSGKIEELWYLFWGYVGAQLDWKTSWKLESEVPITAFDAVNSPDGALLTVGCGTGLDIYTSADSSTWLKTGRLELPADALHIELRQWSDQNARGLIGLVTLGNGAYVGVKISADGIPLGTEAVASEGPVYWAFRQTIDDSFIMEAVGKNISWSWEFYVTQTKTGKSFSFDETAFQKYDVQSLSGRFWLFRGSDGRDRFFDRDAGLLSIVDGEYTGSRIVTVNPDNLNSGYMYRVIQSPLANYMYEGRTWGPFGVAPAMAQTDTGIAVENSRLLHIPGSGSWRVLVSDGFAGSFIGAKYLFPRPASMKLMERSFTESVAVDAGLSVVSAYLVSPFVVPASLLWAGLDDQNRVWSLVKNNDSNILSKVTIK